MTVRITLVCAAPTAANRTFAFPADEPAEPKALAKLAGLTARLPSADRILVSPMLAARQTAEALGLPTVTDPLLRDCNYGRWAGGTLDSLQEEDPAAVGQWLTDPAAAPHGGESVEALIARAAEFLSAEGAKPGHVLAITHTAFIRAAIVHALGAPATAFWRIDVTPLSVTRLSGARGRWNLSGISELQG